jgi:hypothetical protein
MIRCWRRNGGGAWHEAVTIGSEGVAGIAETTGNFVLAEQSVGEEVRIWKQDALWRRLDNYVLNHTPSKEACK